MLSDLSFTVRTGEIFTIVAQCGQGKTTLLKLCCGLLKPQTGKVLVKGRDTGALRHEELRSLRMDMGYVFQHAALISNQTIFNNVALPLEYHRMQNHAKIQKIVHEQLKLTGVEKHADLRPSALPMDVRKRAAIARAMVMNPTIILYDEPTLGLDPINARAVKDIIRCMQKGFGVTSVIVTSDIHVLLEITTKVAVLNHGRFLFNGPPDQLKNSDDPFLREFVKN